MFSKVLDCNMQKLHFRIFMPFVTVTLCLCCAGVKECTLIRLWIKSFILQMSQTSSSAFPI